MKILFVTSSYLPKLGGVESHVSEVANELQLKGHAVTIVTVQNSLSNSEKETQHGIDIVRMPQGNKNDKTKTWWWIVKNLRHFLSADIVHAHDVGWWLVPIMPFIWNKTFTTFHGWEGEWPVRWQAKLMRWLVAFCSRGTMHIGGWIQKFYWDTPTVVLYGGVKRRGAKLQKDQTKHKHTKVLKIVFIGRLVKENDVALYCNYFQKLQTIPVKFELVWLGDGPLKNSCLSYGEVIGMVTNPETEIAQADVVCASSYLSILLARSLGKPVWALHSHALKEAYLTSLPNTEGIFIAGSADELISKVYDAKTTAWIPSAVATSFSKNWPPTWREVANSYETLWQKKLQ